MSTVIPVKQLSCVIYIFCGAYLLDTLNQAHILAYMCTQKLQYIYFELIIIMNCQMLSLLHCNYLMSVANQEFLNKYLLAKNMLVQAFLQIFLDPAFQQACEPDICDKNIMSGVNCSVLNILCNIIYCLSTVLCAGIVHLCGLL